MARVSAPPADGGVDPAGAGRDGDLQHGVRAQQDPVLARLEALEEARLALEARLAESDSEVAAMRDRNEFLEYENSGERFMERVRDEIFSDPMSMAIIRGDVPGNLLARFSDYEISEDMHDFMVDKLGMPVGFPDPVSLCGAGALQDGKYPMPAYKRKIADQDIPKPVGYPERNPKTGDYAPIPLVEWGKLSKDQQRKAEAADDAIEAGFLSLRSLLFVAYQLGGGVDGCHLPEDRGDPRCEAVERNNERSLVVLRARAQVLFDDIAKGFTVKRQLSAAVTAGKGAKAVLSQEQPVELFTVEEDQGLLAVAAKEVAAASFRRSAVTHDKPAPPAARGWEKPGPGKPPAGADKCHKCGKLGHRSNQCKQFPNGKHADGRRLDSDGKPVGKPPAAADGGKPPGKTPSHERDGYKPGAAGDDAEEGGDSG